MSNIIVKQGIVEFAPTATAATLAPFFEGDNRKLAGIAPKVGENQTALEDCLKSHLHFSRQPKRETFNAKFEADAPIMVYLAENQAAVDAVLPNAQERILALAPADRASAIQALEDAMAGKLDDAKLALATIFGDDSLLAEAPAATAEETAAAITGETPQVTTESTEAPTEAATAADQPETATEEATTAADITDAPAVEAQVGIVQQHYTQPQAVALPEPVVELFRMVTDDAAADMEKHAKRLRKLSDAVTAYGPQVLEIGEGVATA